jgi:transposase-like protein
MLGKVKPSSGLGGINKFQAACSGVNPVLQSTVSAVMKKFGCNQSTSSKWRQSIQGSKEEKCESQSLEQA